MLEQLQSYERRNIRPYILGLCFAVGLAMGFIFYIASPSFATLQATQDQKDQQQQAAEKAAAAQAANQVQVAPAMQALKQATEDKVTLPVVPVAETEIPSPFGAAGSDDMRKVPATMTVAINYETGLTGKTTYRPLAPVKIDKPAPPVDFSTRKPVAAPSGSAPKRPVDIHQVTLPELDE